MERGTYGELDDPGPWLVRHLGGAETTPLEVDDVRELAAALRVHEFAGGTPVFLADEVPTHVCIVRSGRMELSRRRGDRVVTLHLLGPGDVFGDVALFLRRPERYDARALEDTVVYTFDSVDLIEALGRSPRLTRRWMLSMARRLADSHDRVSDLLSGNLEQQVASTLLHFETDGRVEMSQEMVARLIGARRTSVNQALRRLEKRSLIRTGYRQISVVDRDGLAGTRLS